MIIRAQPTTILQIFGKIITRIIELDNSLSGGAPREFVLPDPKS